MRYNYLIVNTIFRGIDNENAFSVFLLRNRIYLPQFEYGFT